MGCGRVSVCGPSSLNRLHSLVIPIPSIPAVEERADRQRRDHGAELGGRVGVTTRESWRVIVEGKLTPKHE